MLKLSERITKWLGQADLEVRPWSRDALDRFAAEHGALSAPHVRFEQALFDATGGRGLPVLGGYVFGTLAAVEAGGAPLWKDAYEILDAHREPRMSGPGELVAWSKKRGGAYLYREGAIVHPESSLIISSGIVPFLEQLVLLASHPWIPIRIVVPGQRGEELARILQLPWLVEASDEARFVWAGGDVLIFQEASATQFYFAAMNAMPRVLSACAELDLTVRLESDLPHEIVNAQNRVADASILTGAQYCVTHGTTLVVKVDLEAGVVVQASMNGDLVLEETIFTATHVNVSRHLPASSFLAGRVSTRVLEYCDAEGVLRDPGRTCDAATLKGLLAARNIRESAALFNLEEQFGGILQAHASDPRFRPLLLIGVFQVLSASEETQRRWKIDVGDSSLEADGWPWVRHAGQSLFLVGDYAHSSHLYMSEEGAIYTYHGEIDLFVAAAASARGFLEQIAAGWDLRRRIPQYAAAVLDIDIGEKLAARLSLERLDEASDAVHTHWRNGEIWLRRIAAFPPNRPATEIAGVTANAVVEAVRLALELAPRASVKVKRQPGGRERLDALIAAGLRASFSG